MTAPFVCLQCRQLLRRQSQISGATQKRSAGYIPLRKTINDAINPAGTIIKDSSSTTTSGPQPSKWSILRNRRQGEAPGKDEILENLFASTQRPKPALLFRTHYSKSELPTYKPNKQDEVIDSKFHKRQWQNKAMEAEEDKRLIAEARKASDKSIEDQQVARSFSLSDLDLLDDMLSKDNASVVEIWTTYLDLTKKAEHNLIKKKESTVRIRNQLANTKVFRHILLASCNLNPSQRPPGLPSPGAIIGSFMERGVMRNWWRVVFATQLECLSNSSLPESASSGMTGNHILVMEHIKEIFHVWNCLIRKHNLHRLQEGRWVPDFREIKASCRRENPPFNVKFAECLPSYKLQTVFSVQIAPAALILFDRLESLEEILGAGIFNRELLKDSNSGFENFLAFLIRHTTKPIGMLWAPSDVLLLAKTRNKKKNTRTSPHDYEVTGKKWEQLVQRADYVLKMRPFQRNMCRPSISPVLRNLAPETLANSGAPNQGDGSLAEAAVITQGYESASKRSEEGFPIPSSNTMPLVLGAEMLSLKAPTTSPQDTPEKNNTPLLKPVEPSLRQGAEDDSVTSDVAESALAEPNQDHTLFTPIESSVDQGVVFDSIISPGAGSTLASEPDRDLTALNPMESSIEQRIEDDSNTSQLVQIKYDLSRTTSKRNLKKVIALWDRFRGIADRTEGPDVGRERLYSKFLLSFFEVDQAQLAVQVWNHILKSNTKPLQEHWQIMLVGCRKIKDYASMQQIWQNMITSGIQPDIQSWTEWIHGSILSGNWKRGLQALDEVCKTFSPRGKLEEGHIDTMSQPLCAAINAALSALVAVDKNAEAADVFTWAKKDVGQFNTTTFNIVLRPAVRAGHHEAVQQILKDMQAHHCPPGVVTFTILLDGLMRNPTSTFLTRSFDEQRRVITDMISTLEKNGLKANAYTYGTMLDGLLGTKPPNIIAARAVLDHMNANKVKASSHVYTILVSHYFSSIPPDLAAIDGLWKRIRSDRGVVDHIFYDRMIEGYGRIGEVERMLEFLRRMPTEGKRPGWMALCSALRALIRAEEWDMVQDLIRDVSEDLESSSSLFRGWKGKQEFWDLVQYLRDAGQLLPVPNQV